MSGLYQSERYNELRGIISGKIIPQVYNLIFRTPEFPYWFVFQCYFGIVLSTKAFQQFRFKAIFSLILTVLVAFAPSIFVDLTIGESIPFSESWKSFLLCFLLWAVTQLFQTQLLQKVISTSSVVFGPLHVFGMMRCLQFYNDSTRKIDWTGAYFCGLIISVSDILVAKIFIFIVRGNRRTPFTRNWAFARMLILYSLFFFLTEESPANIVFGILPYKPVGLLLSIVFASMDFAVHAVDVFDVIPGVEEPKQKTD